MAKKQEYGYHGAINTWYQVSEYTSCVHLDDYPAEEKILMLGYNNHRSSSY